MHRARRATIVVACTVAALILPAAVAGAHVGVDVGPLTLTAGFEVEPAYAGQPNAVQIDLEHDGQPVTNLGDALTVTVTFGDTSQDIPLQPNFEVGEWGTPGQYLASFIPSQPGQYSFHVAGEIDGTKVNETFTSGPDTFSDVLDPSEATFPKVNTPTNGELATRIEADATRAEAVAAAANDATSAADSARTTAAIALVLAAMALIAAVAAIARGRKRT